MKINLKWLVFLAACLVIGCNEDSSGVNSKTDPDHTAQTDDNDKTDDNGRAKACEIDGQVKCGDKCIDPQTSNAYCGANDKCENYKKCKDNQSCNKGNCEDTSTVNCGAGQHEYNNECEADSLDHCGSHDNACAMIDGWVDGKCESGQCIPEHCQSGTHINGNSCEADTAQHCGSVENNCANSIEGWQQGECTQGACILTSCKGGYRLTQSQTCQKVTADESSFATNDGISNGITLRLINKSGENICFSGKLLMFIKQDGPQNGWKSDNTPTGYGLSCHLSAPSNEETGKPLWIINNHSLAVDEYMDIDFTEFTEYTGDGTNVQKTTIPLDQYVNGSWYFYADDNQNFINTNGKGGIPAINLGFAAIEDNGNIRSETPFIIHVRPVKPSDSKLEKGKTYNLIIYKAETDSKYWYCDASGEDKPVNCGSGQHEYNDDCEPDSLDHCGSHDNACAKIEGWVDGKCEAGKCVPEHCKNNMHINGNRCEADSIEHCGSVKNNCTAIDGWKDGSCTNGACVLTKCKDGYDLIDSQTCQQAITADTPSFATNDGIPNGITFRLINKSGKDICFSGKFKPYIKNNDPYNGWTDSTTRELECHITAPTNFDGGWPHYHINDQTLAVDEYMEFSLTEFTEYLGNGTTVTTNIVPMDEIADNNWYFLNEDSPNGGPAIKLGYAALERDNGNIRSNSAFIIRVRPIKASDCKIEKGKKYNLIIYKADTESKYWYCDDLN